MRLRDGMPAQPSRDVAFLPKDSVSSSASPTDARTAKRLAKTSLLINRCEAPVQAETRVSFYAVFV